MHDESCQAEIRRLRGAIAAGSLDYRTVHLPLATLLTLLHKNDEDIEAARVLFIAVDLAWSRQEVFHARQILAVVRDLWPPDVCVRAMYHRRMEGILRATQRQQTPAAAIGTPSRPPATVISITRARRFRASTRSA
ncbi:MAG: hypothetical protein Q7T01_05055 [bacterium]|nr:hypothetical protein [bacterium]